MKEEIPYKKLVRSIVVQQLTQSGWVEIIRIPIANPEKNTPDNIQHVIDNLQDSFYTADKIYLSAQGISMCVKGISKDSYGGGTFRVCASYTPATEPFTVD